MHDFWLTVVVDGHAEKVSVSDAYMGSPRLSDIINQALFFAKIYPKKTFRDFEVYTAEGQRLADGRMHRRNDIKSGDTVTVNRPIGIGA